MKKGLKRVLVLCLAVVTVFSVTACKNKKTVSDSGEYVKLSWYLPGDPQEDTAQVVEAMNAIIREKIGAEVEITFLDVAAYKQRMNMMMASRKEFDICHTGYALPYIETVNNGGLMEISEVIEKAAPDLWEVLPGYAKHAVEYNGEIYGIPNIQIYAKTVGAKIRKDLAEKYNLDASKIHKIEDLEPFWAQVRDNEKEYYPLRVGVGLDELDYKSISPIGAYAYIDNQTGEIFNYLESKWNKNRIDMIHDWYQKGYIRADIATVGDDSSEVNAGKYACEIGVYKPGVAEETSAMRGIDYIAIQLTEPVMENSMPSATIASVSACSKNPEKAVELLYLMNTDKKLYNLLCFGIEGKHYKLLEDNLHVRPDTKSGYYVNCSWKFGNTANAYLVEGEPSDKWEQTAKLNEEALQVPAYGFRFNNQSVGTEMAQLSTIQKEFTGLYQGVLDPKTTLPQSIERLRGAGMDVVYEEEVRQFKKWQKLKK